MSSTTPAHSEKPIETPGTRTLDMKLEAVVIPVSDAARSKQFYEGLGWRLDGDFVVGDTFRAMQFTPPGSPASIHFGTGITPAVPGSASGLFLVVADIDAARAELTGHGVEVSEVFHRAGPGKPAVSGRHPERQSYSSYATFKDPDGNEWLLQEVTTRLPGRVDFAPPAMLPQRTLLPPCGARRKPMASTKSATEASATRTGPTGTPSTWWRSNPASRCHFENSARALCPFLCARQRNDRGSQCIRSISRMRSTRRSPPVPGNRRDGCRSHSARSDRSGRSTAVSRTASNFFRAVEMRSTPAC